MLCHNLSATDSGSLFNGSCKKLFLLPAVIGGVEGISESLRTLRIMFGDNGIVKFEEGGRWKEGVQDVLAFLLTSQI